MPEIQTARLVCQVPHDDEGVQDSVLLLPDDGEDPLLANVCKDDGPMFPALVFLDGALHFTHDLSDDRILLASNGWVVRTDRFWYVK